MPAQQDIKDLLNQYLSLQNDPEYTGMADKNTVNESDLIREQQVPKDFGQNIPALLSAATGLNQLGTLQGKVAPLNGLQMYSQIPQPKPPAVYQSTPASNLGLDPKVLEYLNTAAKTQYYETPNDRLNESIAKTNNQTTAQKTLLDQKAKIASDLLNQKQQQQIDTENRALVNKNKFENDAAFIKAKNQWEQDLPARNQDIKSLGVALDILKNKDDPNVTGGVSNTLPDVLSSRSNPNAKIAKDNVKKAIKNMFKQVLGGNFAAQEGKSLEEVYFDPSLPPSANVDKIESLMKQLLDYNQMMKDKVDHYNKFHTISDYNDQNLQRLHNQILSTAQKYGWDPGPDLTTQSTPSNNKPMPSTGNNPPVQGMAPSLPPGLDPSGTKVNGMNLQQGPDGLWHDLNEEDQND